MRALCAEGLDDIDRLSENKLNLPARHTEGFVMDKEIQRILEDIVRGVAAAGKALRLYPATSPIPQQSIDRAHLAIGRFLAGADILSLTVARDGLEYRGEPISSGVPGVTDITAALRSHDIAEISFLPGCTSDELITLLSLLLSDPDDVRNQGGLASALVISGSNNIRVSEVRLQIAEETPVRSDADEAEFLKALAEDSGRLATWMMAAASSDSVTYAEGLTELAAAAGPDGLHRLQENLAAAFLLQSSESKDVFLEVAMGDGHNRDLLGETLGFLRDTDIAIAVTEGLYGKNMLSLSSALTHLPIEHRLDAIRQSVNQLLAESSRSSKEVSFLEHMMSARSLGKPEISLVERDSSYQRVAALANMTTEEILDIRDTTLASSKSAFVHGVTVMLTLLDQQTDFALYCENLDGLTALVPALLDEGDFDQALRIMRELHLRSERSIQPWPELSDRLFTAISKALPERSMQVILNSVIADETHLRDAKELVGLAGASAANTLTGAGIALGEPGLRAAEAIVGRRLLDLLTALASSTPWHHLAPVVHRLARDGGPRSLQVIKVLANNPGEQIRREVACGLAETNIDSALEILGAMIKDGSPEVAITAVRSLARNGSPHAVSNLVKTLEAIDIDAKDFLLAREIIGALARVDAIEATEALTRLSRRKALIKRGHFSEIQELVRQALEYKASQRSGT